MLVIPAGLFEKTRFQELGCAWHKMQNWLIEIRITNFAKNISVGRHAFMS
jgi:hypothetical protein